MHWLYLVASVVCFAITMKATQIPGWITVVLVLAALGFLLAAVMAFLAARLGTTRRDEHEMISPEELRQLREQAQARKAASEHAQSNPNEH